MLAHPKILINQLFLAQSQVTIPNQQNCLKIACVNCIVNFIHLFREHEVFIPSTYRKYYNIKWHGKKLTSLLNKNATNCLVFLVPPFPFTCNITWEFNGQERLAEIEYFLVHTISIPGEAEPKSHLLACLKWLMIHPERNHFGKPVEVCVIVCLNHNQQIMIV